MFLLKGEFKKTCPSFFSFKMHFAFRVHGSKAREKRLAYTIPSCPWACSNILGTEGLWIWPWCEMWLAFQVEKCVRNYFLLLSPLTLQTHQNWIVFYHTVTPHLSLTANLTLAFFLQKHLTLCKNLAWSALLPRPSKSSIGLRSLAWVGSTADCRPPA
jgi:hypothetical protein